MPVRKSVENVAKEANRVSDLVLSGVGTNELVHRSDSNSSTD